MYKFNKRKGPIKEMGCLAHFHLSLYYKRVGKNFMGPASKEIKVEQMRRRATALLPLHYGRAPRWLFSRMVELAECIVEIIVNEYGVHGLLDHLSDPWFFQSLSCVLGYDWHSSGTTTVTCGALKEAIDPGELGIAVTGGKGRASRRTPEEIEERGVGFGLSSGRIEELKYASRMAAKVDNSLVQDGYSLYHHTFIFDEHGEWIVIQQGINEEERNARRYHWPPEHQDLIEEPQSAILCDSRIQTVLDVTSADSEGNRRACVDIARENPRRLRRLLVASRPRHQRSLEDWMRGSSHPEVLIMPRRINWEAMEKVYEFQPSGYEALVSLRGVGPSTLRGLALVAELVYGDRPSWWDPVRFSFAFGGKDGVPFPVDRLGMDGAADLLRAGIEEAGLGHGERLSAIQRLRRCVPSIPEDRR